MASSPQLGTKLTAHCITNVKMHSHDIYTITHNLQSISGMFKLLKKTMKI